MTKHKSVPILCLLFLFHVSFSSTSAAQTDKALSGVDKNGRTAIGDTPWNPEALQKQPKVIYGNDDRLDLYQETDPLRLQLADSVCALFSSGDVTDNGNGTFTLQTSAYTIGGYPACSGEAFANQPSAAYCTGFMVGLNLVATAGHCYDTSDITGTKFVFGFVMQNATTPTLTVPAANVYTGVEIVGRALNNSEDYCIIRVDRNINAAGSTPLPIRRSGTVPNGTQIGVIGHPAGLPLKLAFGSQTTVQDNSPAGYFIANLDTYGGNSGSPVFNASSGIVEGILVRGEQDYVLQTNCFVSNQLPDNAGAEESTKTTLFASLVPQLTGLVSMNAPAYACGGVINLTVLDQNAPSIPLSITVSTGAGDSENVLLIDVNNNDQYIENLQVGAGEPVVINDGVLQGLPVDVITAIYNDADDGTGSPAVRSATAILDCVAPIISNVNVSSIGPQNSTVSFNTNEPAAGFAAAGLACGATQTTASDSLGSAHSVQFSGLQECKDYHFRVRATDLAGNVTWNDNGGGCFSFRTLVFGADTFFDAFEPSSLFGWTHSSAQGADNWLVRASNYAHSAGNVFSYVPGTDGVSDARLVSPPLLGGGELRFWHTYEFEIGFDGGVLEISTNGGGSWSDLGPYITQGGYNSSISTDFASPIGGRQAWSSGSIGAMQEVVVNLQTFPGSVRIGFRFASDDSVSSGGWLVDDVRVRNVEPCFSVSSVCNWRLY